jgi:hypothetical protein
MSIRGKNGSKETKELTPLRRMRGRKPCSMTSNPWQKI